MNKSMTLPALLATLVISAPATVYANICEFVDSEDEDIAIFATNSIKLGTGVTVNGSVVANDASPGPVLDEGVELALDRNATITGDATAVSVDLDNGASVSGTLTCESGDADCTGLTTPVFDAGDIPVFLDSDVRPEAEDVFVGAGETETLGAGSLICSVSLTSCSTDADCSAGEACIAGRTTNYGDIVIEQSGTLIFAEGGRFDVRSITSTTTSGQCSGPCRTIGFTAPTQLRIEGRFDSERGSYVGPAASSGIAASDIAIYIGGQNGATGGLFETPRAANPGRESEVHASFYVPNGTFELEKNSIMTGAVLAADVQIDKDSTFTGDSAFANKPPVADDKDAFTNSQTSIAIGLTGSDPEGQVLTFAKESDPGLGSASVAGSTATYTPNGQFANAEDSFTYTAADACGAVSAPAEVRINPPGDPNIPPDDPVDTVVATDQLCASEDPIDCSLETIEATAITIILSGVAPCDPTDAENPALPCDGEGNDVPLTFSLPSTTTAQGGTLSGLNQGTGELQEPPGPDEVPQRTASVLYTPPPTPFTGVDSFTFDVTGDVGGTTGIVTDDGTVEISVQTFTPVPPVEARDQIVSTAQDTPVDINLSGPAGSCITDPENPRECLPPPEEQLSATSTFAPSSSSTSMASEGTAVTDDTGSADVPAAPARRSGVTIGSVTSPAVTYAALAGEELYAIDSDLDQLFEIDPANASSTLVGSTAAGPTTPASLAFDGVDMFTIDLGGGGLYTLDLNTGAPTLVCSTGTTGWQGVASDPTDEGQFYGITQSDDLYKIDRTTCTTTRVNATAGTVGGLIAALEFDANGTLWGAEFGSPGSTTENAALVTIDKTTGAVTVVSQCATQPCSGSDNFADGFQGIDFSTDGTLYGQNTNDDSLYIIDTTDGSLTFIGANATIFVKGLAFSEEVLLEATFTVLTLPAVGTLSYVDPLTGVSTDITVADLPLPLPTERVTYTPPAGATGDPLTSFDYKLSDGFTSDEGTIELVVVGAVIIVDPCEVVGRELGCEPGGEQPVVKQAAKKPPLAAPIPPVPGLRQATLARLPPVPGQRAAAPVLTRNKTARMWYQTDMCTAWSTSP